MKKLLKLINWDVLGLYLALIAFWVWVFLALGSLAFGADWDKTDKTLFAITVSASAVDTLQTKDIFGDPNRTEVNPIINGGVDLIGEGFIPLYFIGVSALQWWIADNLSPKNRKIFLGIVSTIEVGVVSRNAYLGVGLKF